MVKERSSEEIDAALKIWEALQEMSSEPTFSQDLPESVGFLNLLRLPQAQNPNYPQKEVSGKLSDDDIAMAFGARGYPRRVRLK